MAHTRLQARQILLREDPSAEQSSWLSKLNTEMIPLRMTANVQRMNTLAAAAKKLISDAVLIRMVGMEQVDQARHLMQEIQTLIISLETWTVAITDTTEPKTVEPHPMLSPSEVDDSSNIPIPPFLCPRMLSYGDLWFAYTWNFHSASQIILRESLVDVIGFLAMAQREHPSPEDLERIQIQQNSVQKLSSTIIRSFPQLLGYMHRDHQAPYSLPQGKMLGRFFSLFAMHVVENARFTSSEHKQTASEVIEWIHLSHRLG